MASRSSVGKRRRNARRIAFALVGLVVCCIGSTLMAQPLDVDGDGNVDPYTDVVYIYRRLLGLPPVPQSFRDADPEIPSDPTIAARVDELSGGTPSVTPTAGATDTRTSTRTATTTPSSMPSATNTNTPTRSATLTPTLTATRSLTATVSPTPSSTPKVQSTALVQGAAEVAKENAKQMFFTLPIGCAGLNCSSSQHAAGFRLAGPDRRAMAAGARRARPRGAGTVVPCTRGGMRAVSCDGNVQMTDYDDCAEPSRSGDNTVTRDGRVTLTVVDLPTFCDSEVYDPAENRTVVTFSGYTQIERTAAQVSVVQLTVSQLTETFAPSDVDCGATENDDTIEGLQTIDGEIELKCNPAAESVPCSFAPPSTGFTTDVALTVNDLSVMRTSGGVPCQLGLEMTGTLDVNDRVLDASYSESFETMQDDAEDEPDGFIMTETFPRDAQPTLITQRGRLSVDCLGGLLFSDRAPNGTDGDLRQLPAIEFPTDSSCPTGGEVKVSRAPLVAAAGLLSRSAAVRTPVPRAGTTPTPIEDFRMRLFRALNGQVYQVIENLGSQADLGAEGVRVTAVIGSEAGSVGGCENTAGGTSKAQAVAGAEAATAFPPDSVVKSSIIPFTDNVVFNRNAQGGNGQVCIGPDCAGGATCGGTGRCRIFSTESQPPPPPITTVSAGIPAAELVDPLPRPEDPCSGFGGRAAYRFGASGPTLETQQCALVPDGFVLETNQSVVFAYDTSLAALFNASVSGFPVDLDGGNEISCPNQPGQVLHIGLSELDAVPGPRITFTDAGGVDFDFDDNGTRDGGVASCGNLRVLSQCSPSK